MSRLLFLGLLVLLAVVAGLAKPHEEFSQEHAKEVAQECKAEAGATDEDVEHMMKHEPAASQEGKCLRACVMKKFEIMDEAGKLSKEHAVEMIKVMAKLDADKEATATEIIDTCEAIEVPEDHCDAGAAYVTCIVDHMHEHGLTPEEN